MDIPAGIGSNPGRKLHCFRPGYKSEKVIVGYDCLV